MSIPRAGKPRFGPGKPQRFPFALHNAQTSILETTFLEIVTRFAQDWIFSFYKRKTRKR